MRSSDAIGPRGEETDVGGPSGDPDWSAGWSDDSKTGGFYSNSQSDAGSAFITLALLAWTVGREEMGRSDKFESHYMCPWS